MEGARLYSPRLGGKLFWVDHTKTKVLGEIPTQKHVGKKLGETMDFVEIPPHHQKHAKKLVGNFTQNQKSIARFLLTFSLLEFPPNIFDLFLWWIS